MSSLYLLPGTAEAVTGSSLSLSGAEAWHAVTVARVRVGERISIGDGRGAIATGEVTRAEPAEVAIEVQMVRNEQRPDPQLWLVQALAKAGRDELAVQAATELGAFGVVPWAAARSIVRWDERKRSKQEERWRSIVREATKQSVRAWLPEVAPLAASAADVVRFAREGASLLVLDPAAEQRLSDIEPGQLAGRVFLVVGPEGGISAAEREVFAAAGAQPVRLGAEVLRTSTAGPAALAVLNARLGRW